MLCRRLLSRSILGLALLCGSAFADTLEVAGSTSGSFYLGPVPLGNTVGSLSYTGASFDTTSTTLNLGSFSLGACLVCVYDLNDFKLTIDFTLPVGLTPDPVKSRADVSGTVIWKSGGAEINFSNAPIHMSYPDGAFDLVLSDVSVDVGRTATLYGTITSPHVAATESGSMLLLAAMCGGVLWLFRKRFVTA